MTILGIGTDIVEIARIEQMLARHPERLAARILHPNELERFASQANPAAWLAKRFATKEAIAKAIGTGIGEAVRLQEIETTHDSRGKPLLQLHGVTLATATGLGVTSLHLSVADERTHAVAFVILSGD
ncbi:holo-ACP synthase [Candidatus Thiothrix anitrata]|jgi:holo-[acyl-carrier protein] synthase|uniref:Holo-[acyl-carrier-protein] synthase n=1 Tax=Candidatus Thiothrix anitrata TaxID=2823902 RepID=A0ABX7X4F6_9GAMM|nr:holo-ACP synthase [Candidatus Thiothrix anitrata]QTR49583.1 holo-ACP synthase [Candidatus Thiothrix anitrata]